MKDKPSGAQTLKTAAKWLGRAVWTVNLMLVLFLAAQLFFGYLVFIKGSVELPDFIKAKIVAAAEERGVILEAEKVELFFDFRMEMTEASLRFVGTPEPFFKARGISASISKPALLVGYLKPKSLSVSDAAFFDASEGARIAERISINAEKSGSVWRIGLAQMSAGGVYATLRGALDDGFDLQKFLGAQARTSQKQSPEKEPDLAESWSGICMEIGRIKELADTFTSPAVSIHFEAGADALESIFISFHAQNLSLKRGDTAMEAEELYASVGTHRPQKRLGDLRASLSFRSAKVSHPKLGKNPLFLKNCGAAFIADAARLLNSRSPKARELEIFLEEARWADYALGASLARKDSLSKADYFEDWRLHTRYDGGAIEALLRGDEYFPRAQFSAHLNADKILRLPFLSDIEELKDFAFPEGIFLNGVVEADVKKMSFTAESRVEALNFTAMKIPAGCVQGVVSFDSETGEFLAKDALVQTAEGWSIGGDVMQNLRDDSYAFMLRGSLMPSRITHFMEDWWDKVFSRLNFSGDFPVADAYVAGTWGKPEFIWCVVDIGAKNVETGGRSFESFNAKVLVNPEIIAIHSARAASKNGEAFFNLAWHYGEDGITSFKTNTIDADIRLPQAEIEALAGEDVEDVFSVISFGAVPEIEFHALMFNDDGKDRPEDIFNATINSKGPMSVDTVDLEGAALFARAQGGTVQIDNMAAKLCGGTAIGSARLDDLDDKEKTSIFLRLDCDDMEQTDFFDMLSNLGKTRDEIAAARAQDGQNNAQNGQTAGTLSGLEKAIISGSIEIGGLLHDPKTLKGEGAAHMGTPRLGTIHLLGIISRAVSGLGSNLGTFEITEMHGEFSVSNGEIFFPEAGVRGPRLRISGAARYDFLDDNLRARMFVSPFGSMQTPIISQLMTAIDPFMSVFEVSLEGHIADPRTGIALRPFNFFDSEQTMLRDFRTKLQMLEPNAK